MKIQLLIFSLALSIGLFAQNASVKGRLLDQETQKPVKDVSVKVGESEIKTDNKGVFEFTNIPDGKVTITITSDDFETIQEDFNLQPGESKDLGTYMLSVKGTSIDADGNSENDYADMDFEDENSGQYISGLLRSSSDVFVSTAGFTLNYAFFKIRGYDSEYTDVYMNGILMNDAENDRPAWSDWGGLNDVTRNKEIAFGLSSSSFGFGNIGGATNIITRASSIRKQNKISYAFTNGNYKHRLMYTYSTGLMKNNWAIAASVSRRWAQEGYVPGTFSDQYAGFFAAEKKINDKNSIAFTCFTSPSKRGAQAASPQEIYDLMGTNYYNANWGYQEGEKRNARVKTQNEPHFMLSHYFAPSDKINVTTTVAYAFGKDGYTALNWFNSSDPRPDYYRYLPSYQTDSLIIALVTDDWQNNVETSQIDWNHLYQINYQNAMQGKQSSYIIENRVDAYKQANANSILRYYLNDIITLTAGIEFRHYNGNHYKEISDLLGGNYWLDIDQFAMRDIKGDTSIYQNDLNNPNREVKVGDRFGYDYNIIQNNGLLWAQTDFSFNKVEIYLSGKLSQTQFWRVGNMKNGRAPENSYGKSAVQTFFNYAGKIGATYKITGRHIITANACYLINPPSIRNAYLSPKIKDNVVPDLSNETIKSGDISYIVRSPYLKARVTLYQTYIYNQTTLQSFYLDNMLPGADSKSYVNYIMQGIDKSHQGVEVGADCKVTSNFSVVAVGAYGDYRYISRPKVTVSIENIPDVEDSYFSYLKNFYVTGSPQIAGSFGIKYRNSKYWFANANINYFGKSYLSMNPDRRTISAIFNPTAPLADSLIELITEPQLLNGGYTVDLSIGKSMRYKGHYININFSVNNVLNNQQITTGGYEQMRFEYDTHDVSKFPPKYFYGRGRTFYLNIGIRF